MTKSKITTLAGVLATTAVAAFASTPAANAGIGIPQQPAAATTLDTPPGPNATALDYPPGPSAQAADTPPGPSAQAADTPPGPGAQAAIIAL